MHTLVSIVLAVVATVTLGIPLTAVAVVYREELAAHLARLRRALALDPRELAPEPTRH